MSAPVIFLDIDGVLNSHRSCMAFKGFPHPAEDEARGNWQKLDPVAVGLLRRACARSIAVCVLSSTWRLGATNQWLAYFGNYLGVRMIGKTRDTFASEPRGQQIADWLAEHPEVDRYAILDDDSDMLPEQMDRFVKVNAEDGLSYANHIRLIELLGGTP